MKVSVIIPYLNDLSIIKRVLAHILNEISVKDGEIIIIDNGSFEPLVLPGDPRIRIIRNRRNIGVGGAFNQGVELAKANKIVLMGCDVIPQEGWFDHVTNSLNKKKTDIFCAVSSDFSDKDKPFRDDAKVRYGANILLKMDRSHLSAGNKDLTNEKFFKILQAKWSNCIASGFVEYKNIECILGAFYWMNKKTFNKIHGFNGHQAWGSLEPFISIKARAHGVKLLLDINLNAAHYFGRETSRPSRPDLQYYNMLFMAHTMFSESLRDEFIEYLEYGDGDVKLGRLNVNQAKKMIKRNAGLVKAERDYNNRHFKHGLIANWETFNKEMI